MRSPSRVLGLVLVVGCLLRIVPIWFGLPYAMARPDEETALGHAVGVMRGDWNPQFFHWPSLTFYLFGSLFAAIDWVRSLWGAADLPREALALIGRGLIALCGTASIYVLYRLARAYTDRNRSLVAAAILAVSVLHVRESHFAMTDVLMTLLLLISLTVLLTIAMRDGPPGELPAGATRWCAGAGLIAGLAVSTKYNAAAVAASMAALQLAWLVRAPALALRPSAWAPSLAFAAAMVGGFLAGTPYAVLDHAKFVEDFRFNFEHLSEGHAGVNLGRGWLYHARYSLPHGLGVTAFLAAIIGLWPFVRRYGRAAWVLGAFAAGFYIVVGSGYTVFYRYILPLVPLICLVSAEGVRLAGEWLARTFDVSARGACMLVLVLVLGPGLVHSVWLDLLLARTDTRVLASNWLVDRVRPDDSLHDAGIDYTRLDLRAIDYHPWPLDDSGTGFGTSDGRTPTWIVLYDSPLSAYTPTAPYLRRLTSEKYDLVHQIRATGSGARSATYDHQDAFFLPVNNFYTVERPGPNIKIYRVRE